jgi:glycosyltransferase involved in cell wall biosynthesis
VTGYRLPTKISNYLARQTFPIAWQLNREPDKPYAGTVVIPALAESKNIPQVLQSLSVNPPEQLDRHLILIVVNNRADATELEKHDNALTIEQLPAWQSSYGLKHLYWVDAASSGYELPEKQGVGLSRKIGMDLSLSYLDFSGADPLLICLDADTIVEPDYLQTISRHFYAAKAGAASIAYRHRPAADLAGQTAIDRYELFLRAYVLGLELAGSPYSFHTVGSAMACRATAYVAAGGMNRRLAGEDFYFLQQLYKTAGVESLAGTVVHPSPRSSHRVPFGTGRAVGDMLAVGNNRLLFYQPEQFRIVGQWLELVGSNFSSDGKTLLTCSGEISPYLRQFLEQAGFDAAWDNMRRHNSGGNRLMNAFHGWFDAFRTMRLMHHLTDSAYPRIQPEEAVPPLLELAGKGGTEDTVVGMLDCLRKMQGC